MIHDEVGVVCEFLAAVGPHPAAGAVCCSRAGTAQHYWSSALPAHQSSVHNAFPATLADMSRYLRL